MQAFSVNRKPLHVRELHHAAAAYFNTSCYVEPLSIYLGVSSYCCSDTCFSKRMPHVFRNILQLSDAFHFSAHALPSGVRDAPWIVFLYVLVITGAIFISSTHVSDFNSLQRTITLSRFVRVFLERDLTPNRGEVNRKRALQ